jgi:hypothetical protein
LHCESEGHLYSLATRTSTSTGTTHRT